MKTSSILPCSALILATTVGCASEDGDGGGGSASTSGGASASVGGSGPTIGGSGSTPGSGGASTNGSGGSGPATGGSGTTFSFAGSGEVAPGDETIEAGEACEAIALEPQTVEVPREVTTTTTYEEPAPVALYVMLDNSMSMSETSSGTTTPGVGNASSKWAEATTALTSFVNDPASDGMDIAIQYFHPVGAGETPDECDGVAHATPAVPLGRLPDNASAIESSLRSAGLASSTPTSGALTGATDFCAEFHATNPDENCVVVFVTDGLPNGCNLSATNCTTTTENTGGRPGATFGTLCVDPNAEAELGAIAATGLSNGVVSFMIGMSGVTEEGFALLDALAVSGGSDCTPDTAGDEACDVSTTGADGLLAALAAIRESVTVVETHTETVVDIEMVPVPCEWTIPPSPEGERLDPNLVNVSIVDVDLVDSPPTATSYVSDPIDCERATATGPAWYYDIPEAPTKILACPATCDTITTQTNLSVKVLFGCERPPDAY